MKADDWRKSCGEDDAILSACIDDLAESEREAGILRDALAESERLCVEAEVLAHVLKKAIAQSSTQYREMVAELDDHRTIWEIARYSDVLCTETERSAIDRIEARRERSTP